MKKVLLLIETSRQYGRGLLRGITKYASAHGSWITEQVTPFYIQTRKTVKIGIDPTKWDIDGVIMRDKKFAEKVIDSGIPVIFANYHKNYSSQASCIVSNDKAIGQMAAEYFLERGFKNFAYLGLNSYWSKGRQDGFTETLKDSGCKVDIYKSTGTKSKLHSDERSTIADWLKSLPKPVGLMTCNDDRGKDALAAARAANINIPGQVAVVGCDNDEFVCNIANPPLSSIVLDTEQAGYQAACLLDKLMRRRKTKFENIIVDPTHVVSRQSSDFFAIKDKQVIKAIAYIHENLQGPLQVDDIAQAAAVSRRGLYDKFKKTVNCTVADYINTARIELIAKWLTDTDLTISQIAYKLGFSDPDNIARYFRKHKGLNPSEYRNQHRSI